MSSLPMSASTMTAVAKYPGDFTITQLGTPESIFQHLEQLSSILQECVHEGHSMGFLAPLSIKDAKSYWMDLIPQIEKHVVHLFILTTSNQTLTTPILVGTVQIAEMPKATHLHRADVNKLIISSNYQRRGLARMLMGHVEEFARNGGKEVLTLTTAKESAAREMYLRFGWEEFGVCKKYASWPDGRRVDASFFSRDLSVETEKNAA